MTRDASPEQIGEYQLLRRLGSGAMGEVFLARKRGVGGFTADLAIKRVRDVFTTDEDIVEGLVREARIGGLLHHRHIVLTHGLECVDNQWLIVMEYVEGADLAQVIRAHRRTGEPLPTQTTLDIFARIAEGLHHAHTLSDGEGGSLSLIHRDLKPANVRLSRDGEVKLMDFGLARFIDGTQYTVPGSLKIPLPRPVTWVTTTRRSGWKRSRSHGPDLVLWGAPSDGGGSGAGPARRSWSWQRRRASRWSRSR